MSFTKLTAYLDGLKKKYGVPSFDCVVQRGHEQLYRRMGGFSDAAGTKPVTAQDEYRLFSCTKVITVTAGMQLVEQGKLFLGDPVAKYLPEFEEMTVREGETIRPASTVLTVEDLFTMSGGFNYDMGTPAFQELMARTDGQATTREMVAALAAGPLDFDPSTHFQYSLGLDVLAGIIEVVSGQTFGEYLNEHIFLPLGAQPVTFHLAPEVEKAHFSQMYEVDGAGHIVPFTFIHPRSTDLNYESGSGGLICKVDSYAPVADALACGGVGANGARILQAHTIEDMKRNRLAGVRLADFEKMGKAGYGYGLGVRTLIDKSASKGPVGEFGWDGAAGAYVALDTGHQLSIFYAQHVMGMGQDIEDIHCAIRDLVYEELGLAE
ncbi:Esterase estB [uncultured Clostridium sp.]|nr:Esterase estB [uncultured Clostridium sp.]